LVVGVAVIVMAVVNPDIENEVSDVQVLALTAVLAMVIVVSATLDDGHVVPLSTIFIPLVSNFAQFPDAPAVVIPTMLTAPRLLGFILRS